MRWPPIYTAKSIVYAILCRGDDNNDANSAAEFSFMKKKKKKKKKKKEKLRSHFESPLT